MTTAEALLSEERAKENVVLLVDTVSVIIALKSNKAETFSDPPTAIYQICQLFSRVVIQWILSHCGIPDNETPDILAKEDGRISQTQARHMRKLKV